MNKCKGCQWYNKPYWSIISPCDVCLREETNVETITRWVDPTIEEKDKEIERLNKECINMKDEIKEWCNKYSKLNNKRNKAIEYIENNDLYFQDYDYDYEENIVEYPPTDEQAKQDLLEILKGEYKIMYPNLTDQERYDLKECLKDEEKIQEVMTSEELDSCLPKNEYEALNDDLIWR